MKAMLVQKFEAQNIKFFCKTKKMLNKLRLLQSAAASNNLLRRASSVNTTTFLQQALPNAELNRQAIEHLTLCARRTYSNNNYNNYNNAPPTPLQEQQQPALNNVLGDLQRQHDQYDTYYRNLQAMNQTRYGNNSNNSSNDGQQQQQGTNPGNGDSVPERPFMWGFVTKAVVASLLIELVYLYFNAEIGKKFEDIVAPYLLLAWKDKNVRLF